jgi:hypothetical protein
MILLAVSIIHGHCKKMHSKTEYNGRLYEKEGWGFNSHP